MPIGNMFPQFTQPGAELAEAPKEFAAIRESQAKAQQSQMLANLLGQAASGFGQESGSAPGSQGTSGTSSAANKALMVAGALKLPTQVVEGNLITPFGTFKVGEAPAEKGQREVGEKMQGVKGESDIKTTQALEAQADALVESGKLYKKLHDIHKQYPDLTGLRAGYAAKKGIQLWPGVGEYVGTTKKLQSQINKAISQRGGVGAMQIAGTIKPDVGNQENYNLGMIKSGLEDLLSDMTVVNNRYKAKTGQDLPQYKELKNTYDEYASLNQPQPSQHQQVPNSPAQSTQNIPKGAEVAIYDPQGKLVAYGTKENAAKFLIEPKHRGFYQKVIGNG